VRMTMRVKVEVSLRGQLEVDVPEANVERVRGLDLPVELEQFESEAGVTVDCGDAYASARTKIDDLQFPETGSPGSEPPLRQHPSVEPVARAVAAYYDVKIVDLRRPGRGSSAGACVRMVAMYLARKLTGASFPVIGRYFCGRHHTPVIHGVRKIERLLPRNPPLRRAVDLVEQSLSREVPT